MTDDEKIPSEEEESNGRIPATEVPDDDSIPSENQRGVERIPLNFRRPYSEIGCPRKLNKPSYAT